MMKDLKQVAREYAALLTETVPNGYGQHVHPVHGASHAMFHKMTVTFGRENTDEAVDAAFVARRNRT